MLNMIKIISCRNGSLRVFSNRSLIAQVEISILCRKEIRAIFLGQNEELLSSSKTRVALYRGSRPEVLYKKGISKKFPKFTGKHLRQSVFFNKVASFRLATLFKKILCHRCFSVNFTKFLRTTFFVEHLRWLLLFVISLESLSEYVT